jgi:hypothetical protein
VASCIGRFLSFSATVRDGNGTRQNLQRLGVEEERQKVVTNPAPIKEKPTTWKKTATIPDKSKLLGQRLSNPRSYASGMNSEMVPNIQNIWPTE